MILGQAVLALFTVRVGGTRGKPHESYRAVQNIGDGLWQQYPRGSRHNRTSTVCAWGQTQWARPAISVLCDLRQVSPLSICFPLYRVRVGGVGVLHGRCLAYGTSATVEVPASRGVVLGQADQEVAL